MALAVSGGSDSTALMRLVHDFARGRHPDLRISVLTVDHGLRAASAAEALEVGRWAAELGLVHHVLSWEGPKPRTGLQAKARAARYGLLAQWCRSHGADLLLTGHTLDDQAETVLMRLMRTSSPASLAGIPQHGEWDGVRLFRPLLAVRRQALRDYLSSLDQGWIEDPSNEDAGFERVRLRQSLPALARSGVTPERLARLAAAGARTSALLEQAAGRWLRLWLREEEQGVCQLPARQFLGLPEALQQRVLALVIGHYGGGGHEPEAEEFRRLARWVAAGKGRRTLGGALVGRRKNDFWVTREAARIAPEPLKVPDSGEALWDNRFLVEAPPGSLVTPAGGRGQPLPPGVPAFAGRAMPWIEPPEGAEGRVKAVFLRLCGP